MISNQILQNAIEGFKEIAKTDFCVLDADGNTMASTFLEGERFSMDAADFAASDEETILVAGCQFFKVYDDQQLEYVLVADGTTDATFTMGKMAVYHIQSLLTAYKERFDRDNFIKNLLLDNLLMVDIYNRAKKLHVETEARRVVFIVETSRERENSDTEKLRVMLSMKNKDFITAVDEKNIVVVKEIGENDDYADVEKIAQTFGKCLRTAEYTPHIAFGTIVGEIKEVSRSFKEARMAMDVGKIFFEEREIIAYNSLGIGRLIYQLPIPLCKMFIREILAGRTLEDFGEETLVTIDKFFENSLNVSETSRQLYIHRNTLVYRLDKLQKITNLDLRQFDDAITFKIAMMVVKYMKHVENMEY